MPDRPAIENTLRRCARTRRMVALAGWAGAFYTAGAVVGVGGLLGGIILAVIAVFDAGHSWLWRLPRIAAPAVAVVIAVVSWHRLAAAQTRQKRAKRLALAAQRAWQRLDPTHAGVRQYGAERVVFVRNDPHGDATGRTSARDLLFVRSVAVLCLYFVLQLVGTHLGFVLPRLRTAGPCLVIGIILLAVFRALLPRRGGEHLAGFAARTERLVVIGTPAELDDIGELADVAFEPQEFNVSWTAAALRRRSVRYGFAAAAATYGFAAFALLTQLEVDRSKQVAISLIMAGCAGYIAVAIGWHTYIRVSPGMVELLQYSVFLPQRVYREVVPLHDARVRVNLWTHYVRVEHREATVRYQPWEFATALVPRRRELAYYILLAAISTHAPKPVDDES